MELIKRTAIIESLHAETTLTEIIRFLWSTIYDTAQWYAVSEKSEEGSSNSRGKCKGENDKDPATCTKCPRSHFRRPRIYLRILKTVVKLWMKVVSSENIWDFLLQNLNLSIELSLVLLFLLDPRFFDKLIYNFKLYATVNNYFSKMLIAVIYTASKCNLLELVTRWT